MSIRTIKPEVLNNKKLLEGEIRNLTRKLLFKKLKKYPAILLHIFTA